MADAPGGGGSITGGEILILVVLALGAFAVLSGHPLSPVQNTSNTSYSSPLQQCGIRLSRPAPREIVGAVATVVGSITPCTYSSPLNTIVNVQIVDSTGAPMSAYTPVNVAAADSTRGTFSANIPITGAAAPGIGYVIVTGPNESNGTAMTARVAIRFFGPTPGSPVYIPPPNPIPYQPPTQPVQPAPSNSLGNNTF